MLTALIQLNSGKNKDKNIDNALSKAEIAINKGAKFILLPEMFNYRGNLNAVELYNEVAEELPGQSLIPFMELAKKAKVCILAGSVYEKSLDSEKVYNTSVIIDDSGSLICKYRKINLFKAIINGKRVDESDIYEAGNKTITCSIYNFKVGMSICYDLRFPELFREYYSKRVNLIVVPSSFTTKTGKLHWEVLLRARAIENYSFVLAPNQCGLDGNGIDTYGHSIAIDPQGNVLGVLDNSDEGVLLTRISICDVPKVFNPIV